MGAVILFIGIYGFFSIAISSATSNVGRFYNELPLLPLNGIAVDSKGNVFFGISEHNSIQVYDNMGVFLYRFSFPAGGGMFSFYVDYDDFVHVVTARNSRVFSFYGGHLVGERGSYAEELQEFGRRRQRDYSDIYGNKYAISFRSVRMYDEYGNFLRRISPNAPIWPFPIFVMWLIALVGFIILIIMNWKWFVKSMQFKQV
jgi:hypothetical protein